MRRPLLLTLLLSALACAARAQPSSSFPLRKACREIMPHILYVLAADQVAASGRHYIFQRHLGGADTLTLTPDSLPRSLIIEGRMLSIKFDQAAERLYMRSRTNPAWTLLNPEGYYFHDMPPGLLKGHTVERFLLQAVAVGYLYQTGTAEARQGDRAPGALQAVAYSYTPTRGLENMVRAERTAKTFCPMDDPALTGASVEIMPIGSTHVCYKKGRR